MIEAPVYCEGCEKPLKPYVCKQGVTPTATLACDTPKCPMTGCKSCREIMGWYVRMDEQMDLELGDGS